MTNHNGPEVLYLKSLQYEEVLDDLFNKAQAII